MDLVRLYTDTQARIVELVSPLSAAALAGRVPGTPQWTIQQLVAHLTGIAADMADGRTEGVATPPWTARQVDEREGRPLADVLGEWHQRTPELMVMLATPGQVDASAFDILTHEHDLRGALGHLGASDQDAVVGVTTRVTGRVSHLIDKAELPPLRLVHDDGEWVCGSATDSGSDSGSGSAEVAVTGTATTIEWFRALFGRRSADQILTYRWEGDPSPYFGLLNLFGPLPSAAVAEAGAPVPGPD